MMRTTIAFKKANEVHEKGYDSSIQPFYDTSLIIGFVVVCIILRILITGVDLENFLNDVTADCSGFTRSQITINLASS